MCSGAGSRQRVSMWWSLEAELLAVGVACRHISSALVLIGIWTRPWVGVSSKSSRQLSSASCCSIDFFLRWSGKLCFNANQYTVQSQPLIPSKSAVLLIYFIICGLVDKLWACFKCFHSKYQLNNIPRLPYLPTAPPVLHPSSAACQSPTVT